MSDWKQQVEAQIAFFRLGTHHYVTKEDATKFADTMQALIDVAVAADQLFNELAHYGHESADSMNAMSDALDKLREVE